MGEEIVTIKRIQSENGCVTFMEVRKSADGVVTTTLLPDTDMSDDTFAQIRASLMEISKRNDTLHAEKRTGSSDGERSSKNSADWEE